MTTKSTSDRYGSVAILIHWASAAAVIIAFAAGFAVAELLPPAQQAVVLIAHVALGLSVLVLTLLRIVWWWVADKAPAHSAGEPAWRRVAARTVHLGLYVILILMAFSGIATMVLSGGLPAILAGGPLPDFSTLLPRVTHGLMSKILLLLFVLHVAAALWHQYVLRDNLLARMGIGRA